MSARPPVPDVAERLYALLLRAYPAGFRARFGAEMRQLVRDRRQDAAGTGPRTRFWLELLGDFVLSLPAQYLAALRERQRSRAAGLFATPSTERAMNFRKLLGAVLAALALVHIGVDVADAKNSMGGFAILLTVLVFGAGAVLLTYPRRAA